MHARIPVSSLLRRLVALPGAAVGAVARLAEMLSDAGHGPYPPTERPSDLLNPYAGSGPGDDDRRDREDLPRA